MIKYTLLILVTATLSYSTPTSGTNRTSSVLVEYLNLATRKCYQNFTNTGYDYLKELTENLTECIENKIKHAPMLTTSQNKFKDNIQSCVSELVSQLEECLPDDSKTWPQANLDLVYNIIDFFYENKNQILSPAMTEYKDCVLNLDVKTTKNDILKCCWTNYFKEMMDTPFCQKLDAIEKCASKELDDKCPGDSEIEKLKTKFFETLRKNCEQFDPTEDATDNLYTLLPRLTPPNINPELM